MSDQPSFFSELKQMLIDYFENKVQLYKIIASEKFAKIAAVFISSILIVILSLFLLFFLSLSGGFYFGELLNNNALGFLIIFGIYFLFLLFILLFRKKLVEKYIIDKVIEKIFKKEKK